LILQLNKTSNIKTGLTSTQKDLLKDLYKSCAAVVTHFQQKYSALPKTSSLEEIAVIGNDKMNTSLGKLLRGKLCSTLAATLSDGFDSFTLFGKHFIWDYVKAASTQKNGLYATSATSHEELSMSSTIAKVDTCPAFQGNPSVMFRCFVCLALTERSLEQWLSLLGENSSQLERFFFNSATWRIANQEVIEPIKMLRGLPFQLDMFFESKKS